jgi:hypothetical protein
MSRHALRVGGLVLLALWLAGCSKSSTAPTTPPSDLSQVQALVDGNYGLIDDGESTSSETQAFSVSPAPTGTFAAIHPVFFWRTLTSETLSWSVLFADTDATGHPTRAEVTVLRHQLGSMNIMHSIPTDTTIADTVNVIHKPLDDHWLRHVEFKRVPIGTLGATRWRFSGTSLVSVTSDVNTTRILSVHIQSSTVDTVIMLPSQLFKLRDVIRIQPTDSVRVTVTTNHTDDVVLLHHAFHRYRFRNNGDGTYTIKWLTGPLGGWRHFGVDAIAHGTLFDDTAGYDDNRWHIPFVVTSQAPVDYYP